MKVTDKRGSKVEHSHSVGEVYVDEEILWMCVKLDTDEYALIDLGEVGGDLHENITNVLKYDTLEEMDQDNPHDLEINVELVIS